MVMVLHRCLPVPIELQSGREGIGAPASSEPQRGAALQQFSAETELVQQAAKDMEVGSGDVARRSIFDGVAAGIPIEIDVAVPIRNFRIRDLLALRAGQVIRSQWVEGEDLPMGARGAQIAWSEFEAVDERLAARITRLA